MTPDLPPATANLETDMQPLRELPPNLVLLCGAHDGPGSGFCVMEAVAWVAGEPWSDHPECACPAISTFLRSWNDDMPTDEDRTRLLAPLIPRLVGTRSTPNVELARVMLCVDWIVRESTPAWLDAVPALAHHAETLRALRPIQSWDDLDAALVPLRSAQGDASAAWAAARDAALDAAWSAAWDAARGAAWSAAWDTAWPAAWDTDWPAARAAAWSAARDAARDAAWSAAWDAARDAARDALAPITARLQTSAVALVERMIAL